MTEKRLLSKLTESIVGLYFSISLLNIVILVHFILIYSVGLIRSSITDFIAAYLI